MPETIKQALSNSSLKHYYLPSHSSDLNLVTFILNKLSEDIYSKDLSQLGGLKPALQLAMAKLKKESPSEHFRRVRENMRQIEEGT